LSYNIKDIFKPAESFLLEVSAKIEEAIKEIDAAPTRKLLEYALSQKGQMLRPGLIYTTAFAYNHKLGKTEYDKLLHYACAIELLHTASLVHDDIIDAAGERRGKKSIYSLYGSNNAVLTGNIFYLTAFDITNKNLGTHQIDSIIRAASDMCSGEIIQLSCKDKEIQSSLYFDITSKKTASLIKYAFREASRISGANSESIIKAQELGESLGILYQLYDDYIDKDVNLEQGFDFKLHSAKLLAVSREIISGFLESDHKSTFQKFLNYFKSVLEA
jgi:geranylgeranyl pyrophosphate synthase